MNWVLHTKCTVSICDTRLDIINCRHAIYRNENVRMIRVPSSPSLPLSILFSCSLSYPIPSFPSQLSKYSWGSAPSLQCILTYFNINNCASRTYYIAVKLESGAELMLFIQTQRKLLIKFPITDLLVSYTVIRLIRK